MNISDPQRDPASFRDPDGFVFRRSGKLYRQVNRSYAATFTALQESGLLRELAEKGLLVSHQDSPLQYALSDQAAFVIAPTELPFISYPYEWCFSQLKAAALLTLDIQKRALERGFSLKDCSAYNVQFQGVDPLFIDTLSFESYQEGRPWSAYRQFCEHFLLPLALMSYRGPELNRLTALNVSGIELGVGRKLLPLRSLTSFSLLTHIHLHGYFQRREGGKGAAKAGKLSRYSFTALLDHLTTTVKSISLGKSSSFWERYYSSELNYDDQSFRQKCELISQIASRFAPKLTWDIGANTGHFSRLVAKHSQYVVSSDFDPFCVERSFTLSRSEEVSNVHPLVLDLCNPTPAVGWANRERKSFFERGPADLVLALALIHHLAIGNNVPLLQIAKLLSETAKVLVIEFVPKSDSQVVRMLASRKDIFEDYHQQGFEGAFNQYFHTVERFQIAGSERSLYLMERRG